MVLWDLFMESDSTLTNQNWSHYAPFHSNWNWNLLFNDNHDFHTRNTCKSVLSSTKNNEKISIEVKRILYISKFYLCFHKYRLRAISNRIRFLLLFTLLFHAEVSFVRLLANVMRKYDAVMLQEIVRYPWL